MSFFATSRSHAHARALRSALAASFALLVAREARSSEEGELFLEVEASSRSPFVEQEILLRVRFGIEAQSARPLLVQPFQRALEVPIQVQAPWLAAPPGLEPLPARTIDAAAPRCALDGAFCAAIARGEQERDGRRYAVWEIERRFAAPRAGRWSLPAIEALCVLGLRREQDLFGETQIVGRRELRASSAPFEIEVRDAPADGRPSGYRNAVGGFELEARLDRTRLRHDETLRLELRVSGTGNLERLALPALDDLAGFHRLGFLDAMHEGVRVARYDLAPRTSGTIALGPIELPFLDPGPPARYRAARSAEFRVEVAPDPAAAAPSSAAPSQGPEDRLPWIWFLAAALTVAAVAALAAFAAARKRRETPRLSLGEQLASRDAAASSGDAHAVLELLADWLECPPAALHEPSVAQRFETRGAHPETAQALASALAHGIAARYGSRGCEISRAQWIALLEALERESTERSSSKS
ncbi:MAG: BatD family protein [Planctomycetes bacterium]|nr:BatD family protein [Planctomycetota bacterium]